MKPKFDIFMLLARLHFDLIANNEHYRAAYVKKELND